MATGKFKQKKILGIRIIIASIIVLFFSTVYALTNDYDTESVSYLLQLVKRLYIDPMLLYIIAFLLIDSQKDALRCLMTIVVFFSLLNIISLILMKFNINFFLIQEHSKGLTNRFSGLIGNPNKTSYLLCSLLPFMFFLKSINKGKLQNIFFLGLVGLSVFTIGISGSRGGLFALIFTAFYLLFFNKQYSKLLLFSVFFSACAMVVLGGNLDLAVVERLQPLIEGDFSTGTSGRLEIWGELFNVYSSNLFTTLFGLGVGMSEMVGMKADPHNFYLQILSEFGIVGFIFFIGSASWLIVRIWLFKGGKQHNYRIYLSSSLFVVGIAWCASSLDGIMNFVLLTIGVGISYLQYLNVSQGTDDLTYGGGDCL
jgi:O-antigen ligase